MAAAVLLMLLSGLFLAGWVTVMSTRAIQVSWLEDAVLRRIALENSRAMAWQTTMSHGFTPDAELDGKTALLLGGKQGGLSTDNGWKALNLYTLLDTPESLKTYFPYNHTGFRPGGSYMGREKFLKPVSLLGLDSYFAHLFLKSQCPVLNGDLFTVYRKPDNFSGELNIYSNGAPFQVYGRVVIRHPPSLFVKTTSQVTVPIQSKSLYIQSHDSNSRYPIIGTDLNGKELSPSNMPVVPSSTGPNSKDDPKLFDGYLNVIRNQDYPDNSLWDIAETGKYTDIEVFQKSLSDKEPWYMVQYNPGETPRVLPPAYPSGYDNVLKTLYVNLADPLLTHLRIVNNGSVADQIVFVGQTDPATYEAAGALSPVIVILVNGKSKWTKNIAFEHENNRRLIIAVKDELSLGEKRGEARQLDFNWAGKSIFGDGVRWRMTLINEGHFISLKPHENTFLSLTWIGGVMTNWSFLRDIKKGTRPEGVIFKSDSSVPTLPVVGASYASLLPRDVWLESYFLPEPPPTTP